MSRGGRGGGRGGGGKRGPDLSWDDEESTEIKPDSRRPQLLFPSRYIPTPKPLTADEEANVQSFINIRDRIRSGPLYTVLDPTIASQKSIATKSFPFARRRDQIDTKPNPRSGFNPFTDQEKYTLKYHRKKRVVPDLSTRGGYTLRLFPLELWSVLDPKRKMRDWESLTDEQKARVSTTATGTAAGASSSASRGTKRKRTQALEFEEGEGEDEDDHETGSARRKRRGDSPGSAADDDDDDDDDAIGPTRRSKNSSSNNKRPTTTARQKKGLDAEDDYPDVDQRDKDHNDDDNDDVDGEGTGEAGEDEPLDSEYDEDEDEDGMDDYNAEQYFEDGVDDFEGGGGDDGGGDDGGGYM